MIGIRRLASHPFFGILEYWNIESTPESKVTQRTAEKSQRAAE
jgi:hypothetical protein